jgi:hypothetical protein
MDNIKVINLAFVICLLSGCAFFQGPAGEYPFISGGETEKAQGRYLTNVPLSEDWSEVRVLNYSPGNFSFPPAAGYKLLQYVDYEKNVALDMYRELIDERYDLLDIIKYRQGSDHCNLYGERFTAINGIDLIEVEGDCHIWHRGDFKRKYYFVRVGPIVFTFRLLSNIENFETNLKEFTDFMDFTLNNYLIQPIEGGSTYYQNLAYPLSGSDLISFFQPAVEELKKKP